MSAYRTDQTEKAEQERRDIREHELELTRLKNCGWNQGPVLLSLFGAVVMTALFASLVAHRIGAAEARVECLEEAQAPHTRRSTENE